MFQSSKNFENLLMQKMLNYWNMAEHLVFVIQTYIKEDIVFPVGYTPTFFHKKICVLFKNLFKDARFELCLFFLSDMFQGTSQFIEINNIAAAEVAWYIELAEVKICHNSDKKALVRI
jgi:hypothetical protein